MCACCAKDALKKGFPIATGICVVAGDVCVHAVLRMP